MTKPVTLPRWSTDLSNVTTPSSGQQDTGWTVGQDGVSDYQNWLSLWTYNWIKWLDDGDLGDMTLGNITVTGATTFTGDVTVALTADVLNLDPLSTGNTSNIHTVYINANADGHIVSGLVGGVDGREIDIVAVGSYSFYLKFGYAGDTPPTTAGNRINLPATVVAEDDRVRIPSGGSVRLKYTASTWVVVSLSGCLNYQRTRIPVVAAQVTGGTNNISYVLSNTVVSLWFPITLPSGSIIDAWKYYIKKNSNNTFTVGGGLGYAAYNNEAIVAITGTGVGVSDTSSANNPGYITLTNTAINHMVTAANPRQYFGTFSTSGGGSDYFMYLDVFAWVPF